MVVGAVGLVVCLCVVLVAAAKYFASDWRDDKLESLTGASSVRVTG